MASRDPEHEVTASEPAAVLARWFDRMLGLLDDSLFHVATDEPHRKALFSDLIGRNGRQLHAAEIDPRGELYAPICLVLGSVTRRLRLSITPEHWNAALTDVTRLHRQLTREGFARELGFSLGTPATVFKDLTCEALRNAGMLEATTSLNAENRRLALGVALNWGLRLLLAYSLEAEGCGSAGPDGRDLAWIRRRMLGFVRTS